jgi:hypothetical protein
MGVKLYLSLTLREKYRLRVFENRVLRKILGPKTEKAAGSWVRLYNEELHNLHSSTNIVSLIKLMRMRRVWCVACVGERRNAYKIFVGEPEGIRPLGRTRRRWEDNIGTDVREIGWGGVSRIHLAQDKVHWWALVDTIMKFLIP